MTLYSSVPWKNQDCVECCFVFQIRPLPGTSVLYLRVAFDLNSLLLAVLGLAVGLA